MFDVWLTYESLTFAIMALLKILYVYVQRHNEAGGHAGTEAIHPPDIKPVCEILDTFYTFVESPKSLLTALTIMSLCIHTPLLTSEDPV